MFDVSLIWKGCLIVGSLAIAAATSIGLIKWKHDNQIEEAVEMYVHSETGIDFDLTPQSPEDLSAEAHWLGVAESEDGLAKEEDFLDKHKLDMVTTTGVSCE